jgi:hypothetical protein
MISWWHASIATAAALIVIATPESVLAQSLRTEHTYKLNDPDSRPPAALQDVSWLAGSWSGEAFGSNFEEVWNPPSAGSMVGLWKLMNDGQVVFYEIMLIVEEEGSLSLKVKHFNDDFTAWEEKADFVRFRFVKVEADAVHFEGISFYRIDENDMHAFIVMKHEGDVREEKMVYRRND